MYGFQKPPGATAWIYKDPDSVLDYTLDWSRWLEADQISSVVWTVPAGLTKQSQAQTSTAATVWLSGGVAGQTYTIVCRITTQAARQTDRTFRVVCKDL